VLAQIAEVVSVAPYPLAATARPASAVSTRRTSDGGMGAPPIAMRVSEAVSRGCSTASSTTSRRTAGTPEALVSRSVAMSRSASAGSQWCSRARVAPESAAP
jgi:hypothetical protein